MSESSDPLVDDNFAVRLKACVDRLWAHHGLIVRVGVATAEELVRLCTEVSAANVIEVADSLMKVEAILSRALLVPGGQVVGEVNAIGSVRSDVDRGEAEGEFLRNDMTDSLLAETRAKFRELSVEISRQHSFRREVAEGSDSLSDVNSKDR